MALNIASPGRINLIGEHTDYNDGYVLPAAIDKKLYLTFNKNQTESTCRIKSKGFDAVLVADLNQLAPGTEGWHNYVLGILSELKKLTKKLRGFDCEMYTEVPVGSGVSSSASLECGMAYGLNELFELGLDQWELIKLSQRAEHTFVGTMCGIMDQFSSIMGKENHTMLLDCKSLDFEYIPAHLDPYVILMLNTNVSHNLATSGYNTRREESASGLKIISDHFQSENSFRYVDLDMIETCKEALGEIRYKRCRYVVEENERVLAAAEALKKDDLVSLGKLLYLSHNGQSKWYEVSCPELDFLVEFSKPHPYILGARMVGGGFGGCTLNLIHKDKVEEYLPQVKEAYYKKFGIELSHFITTPSQGTSIH